MPRVANPPAGKGRPAARNLATPHKASPMKLAMNDDRVEKAERLKSRQALREVEPNNMQSPVRKRPVYREESGSPQTPRSSAAEARRRAAQGISDSPGGSQRLNTVSQASITPMKRGPILANFEEWMKMATDNKINATNSWNFALIDYFHDMSLLKEGDGVNFQKASCTLDGCVKIYTSRVDSVATETGRLLSGLADSGEGKARKGREEGEEGEEGDEEDDEDGDGGKKKTKRKPARSHEATLAPSFASLQLKKLELEFAVDPLFKKASADFDEGGAKGLLLNHLCIDAEGRIVFDSSDDAGDAMVGGETTQAQQQEQSEDADQHRGREETRRSLGGEEEVPKEDGDEEIDLDSLAAKFFPSLSILDEQDICPSMKSFKLGDLSGDLSIPFLKAPDDWKSPNKRDTNPPPKLDFNLGDQTGIFLDGTNAAGFDDDDDNDGIPGGFDMPDNVGFGEGGEAWAKDAALEPMLRVVRADDGEGDGEDEDGNADAYTVQLQRRYREENEHASILQYFDKAFNSKKGRAAWSKGQGMQGAEYWRIAKIQMAQQAQNEKAAAPRTRKEKEVFEIDFFGEMSEELVELLKAPPASNAAISLPRAQWKSKGRNLLERDSGEGEWVDVKREMVRLWLKPKALIRRRKGGGTMVVRDMDARDGATEDEGRKGDYDANFFADDDEGLPFDIPLPIDDDDDGLGIEVNDGDSEGQVFIDAREMLSPPPNIDGRDPPPDSQAYADSQGGLFPASSQSEMLPGSFGSQLVTQGGGLMGRKLRPEYMSYARVAKKVDVRRLKEEMWKGMVVGLDKLGLGKAGDSEPNTNGPPTPAATEPDDDGDVDMMDIDEPPEVQEVKIEKDVEEGTKELNFTDMIRGLGGVYPEQQMKDISTSYCFICLLHLANEKGLVLEGGREVGEMQEIRVSRDRDVDAGYVGE